MFYFTLSSAALYFYSVAYLFFFPPLPADAFGSIGEDLYIDVLYGDVPVVLSAPHGGWEQPEEIPDRTQGTFVMDWNTFELALQVAGAIFSINGTMPFVVANRLHRIKMDPNREVDEATQGGEYATKVYNEYHMQLQYVCQEALNIGSGDAILFDIHGHGHPERWVEVGHLLTAVQLTLDDQELPDPGYEWVRGPHSIGALLQDEGFEYVVPSPEIPHPNGGNYFSGGYITKHYRQEGMRTIQLEMPYDARTHTNLPQSAAQMAWAIVTLVDEFKIGK